MSLENTKLLITPNGYKAGKLYSALPESGAGDSTFARATTATRVNAEGLVEEVGLNVPRVDYPVLGGCPSLLLEPQRTNLVVRSEEFDNASWVKLASTVSFNVTLAPNGTLSADKLIEDTTSSVHRITQLLTLSTTLFYSFSVFAKKGERNIIQLRDATNGRGVWFNIDTGVVLTQNSGITGQILNIGNGWFKCSITFQPLLATLIASIQVANADSSNIYIGDGISGIFIWGAQLEQASTDSSYIPTLASAVTRNTDVLSNDMTATVDSTYTALLDVSATGSRLKIEDATTGFDLPLNGAGRIVMVVDSNITFHFPDNGQATTVLTYAKPSDLRNIDVLSKINQTKIKVIAVENGVALQSRIDSWVSGSVSSYFLDTDWSLETSFSEEFRDSDWDYFPLIDTSSGTSFIRSWRGNNLTSFPLIDTSSGVNFSETWRINNLTSFPLIDTSSGIGFFLTWQDNNLTLFPRLNIDKVIIFQGAWQDNNLTTWLPNYFDTCVGTNFISAWLNNAIDQTGVDNILVSINTARLAGVQTGTTKLIGLNGGTNATPSATGQAATDALRADGWTVNLNGY